MDKSTQNDIQRATQAGRTLLERAFSEQLEGTYDILLDGTISELPGSHLSAREKVIREKLVAAVAHKRSTGLKAKEAVDAYLREAAFTTLNRFVALKMLEARKLVQECVSKGEDSSGFKEFTALAPGLVVVENKGYQLYIEALFEEIGQEVKVLFERRDVASLLWPDRQTLLELLGILNVPELASVWAEDETIGWVYQYFNGDEERAHMRKESQAPRNSHELAVLNQFFTPRYVVQFLTDNTLGLAWYELMQGDTKLAYLDYLMRRPNEVFLSEGETVPELEVDDSESSQEELLQQTVYVPFRAKRDPRDLGILDPACGSGHFLLYAFELLVTIYEEAWGDAEAAAFTETGTQLRTDYGSVDELRRAIPKLILCHNLHGVDIDPRAAQIAAFALWMRAQRAYNQFDVDRANRPPITKTNIVVAEPMPGDAELVDEFAANLKPAVLGDLFKRMVEEMKLAGELGSLLKIEELISKAVKDAEKAHRQGSLFAEKIENQDFWDTADEKIIAALGKFAESTAGSAGVRRKLFAGDALQGLALIELTRKRFDVVLMNPPFGNPPSRVKLRLDRSDASNLYSAFVRRGCELGQAVGAITDRTFTTQSTFESYRRNLLGGSTSLTCLVDLGWGVLDSNVQVTAYVARSTPEPFVLCCDLRNEDEKAVRLKEVVNLGCLVRNKSFDRLPGAVLAYQLPETVLKKALSSAQLNEISELPRGLGSNKSERTYRAWVEVPIEGLRNRWQPLANGGEFSPFFRADLGVADWEMPTGRLWVEMSSQDAWRPYDQSKIDAYFRPGLSFPKQSSSFNASALPAGFLPTREGKAVLPTQENSEWWLLAFLNSGAVRAFVRDTCGLHKQSGAIGRIPLVLSEQQCLALSKLARRIFVAVRFSYIFDETSRYFVGPFAIAPNNLRASLDTDGQIVQEIVVIDSIVTAAFGLKDKQWLDHVVSPTLYEPLKDDLESWAVGVVFGRFIGSPDWSSASSFASANLAPVPVVPPAIQRTQNESQPSIMVDDPGHPCDISTAVSKVLPSDFEDRKDKFRTGVAELFFEKHIERYKLARRKTPIYWQLATPSASYSVWCYYHRLTRDTFFCVANDFVMPKVDHEKRKLNALRKEAGLDPSSKQRKAIDAQETFVAELRAFAIDVNRIAPLWNPNLNDGVIINFAPLWHLVPQHKPWQKECKKVWDKLVKGDYDWAQLAMHLWPERVVPKCQDDRSLAIAHGLEEAFWYEDESGKKTQWKKRQLSDKRIEEAIAERSSTAVKAALKDLLDAPAPAGQTRRKRRVRA